MRKKGWRNTVIVLFLGIVLLCGCREESEKAVEKTAVIDETASEERQVAKDLIIDVQEDEKQDSVKEEQKDGSVVNEPVENEAPEKENVEEETAEKEPVEKDAEKQEILQFVDVFGKTYETEILSNVPKHTYVMKAFRHQGSMLFYEGDERFEYKIGVDVSHHQGEINWEKVKAAGIDFAFLRIGYRGYGTEGSINLDQQFERNIKNAQAAGIDVGVYFFAQAINEEEAKEEAEFVLEHLKLYHLQLPVVYDPESILDAKARTDDVSGEQFTRNTRVFCELIKEAGYEPMVYSNMLWEAFELDMTKLSDIPVWYADYEPLPQTPYEFEFWQYSNNGHIDGIGTRVDMDIWIIKKDS